MAQHGRDHVLSSEMESAVVEVFNWSMVLKEFSEVDSSSRPVLHWFSEKEIQDEMKAEIRKKITEHVW